MPAKVLWQALTVSAAAWTTLCITSRFLRHIWTWSGTSPASSRQWWLSSQATLLPLSASPLLGEERGEGTVGTGVGVRGWGPQGTSKRGPGERVTGGRPEVSCCRGPPGEPPCPSFPFLPPLHPVTHSHWMAAASPSWQSRMAVGTAGWPMAGDRTAGPGQAGTRAARPLYTRGRCRPAPRGGEQRRFRCHSQLAALREDGEAAPAPVLQPGCLGTPVSAAWSGGSLFRYPRCRCGCPQSGISLGKKPRQHRAAPCNVVAEGAWALPCPPCAPLSAPRPQTTSQPSEALRRPRHRTHAALPG